MTFVRSIGRWTMTALVINCTIGSGIFALPGELNRSADPLDMATNQKVGSSNLSGRAIFCQKSAFFGILAFLIIPRATQVLPWEARGLSFRNLYHLDNVDRLLLQIGECVRLRACIRFIGRSNSPRVGTRVVGVLKHDAVGLQGHSIQVSTAGKGLKAVDDVLKQLEACEGVHYDC